MTQNDVKNTLAQWAMATKIQRKKKNEYLEKVKIILNALLKTIEGKN